jgi:hypothetical protein
MAAGERSVLDDRHGFVEHLHYAITGIRCQVPGVRSSEFGAQCRVLGAGKRLERSDWYLTPDT